MGAPVDEAGLAHVEVADDNHLGEAEPVRNVAMLLSDMVTRASSYTHGPSFPVLPHYEPPLDPGQGTGHLLRHAGISVPIAGPQRGGQESLRWFWELCIPGAVLRPCWAQVPDVRIRIGHNERQRTQREEPQVGFCLS